ncbi:MULTISPECIES: hypothetical protein [Nocardia]|uniref:Uncharacterized protein n=1 Tax=Nocardia sputorum TaxID=2984338 RepID=A0ABN6TW49_9NOCA|nr:hypothetical protein [Nocardia sputorum]BDT97197.1 hypothetical protein IFM12276_02260 [Nocardia sputorum]
MGLQAQTYNRTGGIVHTTTLAVAAAFAALAVGAAPAHASAEKQDGPVSLTVIGEGLVIGKTVTTYASPGGEGQVQAYYIVVSPDGKAKRINSEVTQPGAKGSGVYRDSYGPTGGFLDGTRICAGWWDPTGRVSISGYPCVTIHK